MSEAVDEQTDRATKVGRVVSDKMDKTIVVEVERRVQHAEYTRTIKRTSRFHAHDEKNEAKVGRPRPDRGDAAAVEAEAVAAERRSCRRPRRREQP